MDTYDESMAQRFRAALLRQASQLDRTLETDIQVAAGDDALEVADQKDAASRDAQRWLMDAQTTQASAKLDEICAALSRIRDGSFGRCIECGEPIDLLRLAAMPEAARCAPCQGEHEHAAARERR